MSLQILNIRLVLLCLHHIVELVLSRITSESTIRPNRLVLQVCALDTVVNLVSNVPVPHSVKIDVSHLVAHNSSNDTTILHNFACEVVHWPFLIMTNLVPACDPVLLVFKLALAAHQMDQCAPKRV